MIDSNITVTKLIEECKKYYALPNNSVGGSLHIVLDDGNIHDEHVKFCIGYAEGKNDNEGVLLGKMILKASKTQRKKLYNNYHLYYK
jgi:hypothetical protein